MTVLVGESVVFIDDDEEVRRANAQSLELAGFEVRVFAEVETAQSTLSPDFPGVVVTDVRLPRISGLTLLRQLMELDPDLPVILITGHGDIPMAVEAMREGAYDFFEKPYPPDRLIDSVRRAAEKRRLVLENRALRAELAHHEAEDPVLLGRTSAVEKLRQTLASIAEIDIDVLIIGEAGSGKQAAATAIHRWSRRRQGKFVGLNCSAIPMATAESELFGQEAGRVDGSARRRIGRMDQADRGTLFLAEVESLPLTIQARMIGVLQQRIVAPLGSDEARPVDVRVVAATDADLAEALRRREFREDLFYRLSVVTVRIPPLRERRADIPLLYEHFCSQAAKRFGRVAPVPTPETMRFLLGHPWPGNVRELACFAERRVLGLGDGAVGPSQPATRASLAEQMEAFERGLIVRELAANNGDTRTAAEALEIPRKTLYDKLSRHSVDPRTYRGSEGTVDQLRTAPLQLRT
jgi:two-component system, NtrC family, C4-dicarboxylate transport response regulator DctD